MSKYLLPILFSLIVLLGFNSNEPARRSFALNPMPSVTPTPADQNDSEIVLDKYEVCRACQPGFRPNEDSDCDINIVIKVAVGNSENKNINCEYTVSGGRIIGEGAKVDWDMNGAQPGTYQIRVDIRDKATGQKSAATESITVKDQTCGGQCVCPTLEVDAPKLPVKAGETIIFTANVSGGSGDTVTYNWTVSDGEIIEGQGTPVIKVATNSRMAGKVVKATLEIGGVCESCQRTAEANGSIAKPKQNKK